MKASTRTQKLAVLLKDPELAGALVEVGLDTPAKIKAASAEQIEKAKGVGPATRAALQKRFPKAKKGAE